MIPRIRQYYIGALGIILSMVMAVVITYAFAGYWGLRGLLRVLGMPV